MNTKDKLKLMEEIRAKNEANVKEWKESMKKSKSLRGILISPKNGIVEVVEIPNTLDGLKDALKCEYIETAIRTVAGKQVMVVCDEEGRLKDGLYISGVWAKHNVAYDYFVGNILVISSEVSMDGDMVSLPDHDIKRILDRGLSWLGGTRVLRYEP